MVQSLVSTHYITFATIDKGLSRLLYHCTNCTLKAMLMNIIKNIYVHIYQYTTDSL